MHVSFLANAIRILSMDAVQKANSGHPGMPMGMADIAEVLWNEYFNHNPQNPQWPNRDRFMLSNGHGSMLQYALLHLTGYDLSIEDIQSFRQFHSKTPGHPEYGITPGVETTTGPLGQGFANAVGMALAEQLLAKEFNRENFPIIDHYTYCFVGDGCLMEGISHEVGSLAGTLGIGKLIVFWDNNGISIDGETSGWFLEDTAKRFEAYGWHVIPDVDGHDRDAVKQAIIEARQCLDKPSFICCKTIIGCGAPTLSGTEKVHGAALGEQEVLATRKNLQWKYEPFHIPAEIYQAFDARKKGEQKEQQWKKLFHQYQQQYPELAKALERRFNSQLPAGFEEKMTEFAIAQEAYQEKHQEMMATRKASQKTLEMLIPLLPELFGGSADLSESNLTFTKFSEAVRPKNLQGNYLYYGVREFGMSAMMNGMSLYKAFIPYGGTFLTFLDYGRNAVRLSALMKIRVIFIYTHDSVGLGEDGPTHQPIEHLVMLRATPNMSVWRPSDLTETIIAWREAIKRQDGPTSLILTRQTIPHHNKTSEQIADIERGGYILKDCEGIPEVILIATGSEVQLAMQAEEMLAKEGIKIRVISMPSMDTFLKQDRHYQEMILPSKVKKRVAIEAAATIDWYRFVGEEGEIIGIDSFGESAPYKAILEALGLTVEVVVKTVKNCLLKKQEG